MDSIDISELKNYSPGLIEAFLVPLVSERLEIIIPKQLPEVASLPESIFHVYSEAAYIGDQFSRVSETFSYFVPCASLPESFRFIVDCRNLPGLVQVIHHIVTGYFYNASEENDIFNDKVSAFFRDAVENRVTSSVWGLIGIATGAFDRMNKGDEYGDHE